MRASGVVSLVGGIFALAALPATAADWLILEDFTLIDGTGAPARAVASLAAKDGVIVAIDGRSAPADGDIVVRVKLGGAYATPGLIDTHVHVGRFPEGSSEAERILKAAVRGGVTAVRDLGGDARALGETSRAMAQGEFVGPTLAYAAIFGGLSLFSADQRMAGHAVGYAPGSAPWSRAITPDTDIERATAEAKGAGASVAKIYANLDAKLAGRLIGEARRQGLTTAAHATVFPAGPGDLVDAGVQALSHAPYLVWEAADSIPADYGARTRGPWTTIAPDHPKLVALYKKMARKRVFLDATLFVYRDMASYSPQVQADWTGPALEWAMKAVRVAHQNGVAITTGTDWFEPRPSENLPHTHEELALLVEAGLNPMDAIVAATRNGAACLGILKDRGTVEVGKAADLLILNADPLADIANTQNIRFVVRDGALLTPEAP
jgi:imidazolonepropionase-like amidohydrolase